MPEKSQGPGGWPPATIILTMAISLNVSMLSCFILSAQRFRSTVDYKDIRLNIGFRADIIFQDKVLIELKSVYKLLSIHNKQMLTYLKLSNLKLGLLINLNTALIKDGIKKIVNDL